MSVKEQLRTRLLHDVVACGQRVVEGSWRVLVLDELTTEIVSSCCRYGVRELFVLGGGVV